MPACRDAVAGLDLAKGEHAGLLLSRYLRTAVKSDGPNDFDKYTKMKPALLEAAIVASLSAKPIYAFAFKRWEDTLSVEPAKIELHVQGRLIVGLGGDNVLETGLTLHHTYGVPYIPGTALKGLAAHYCDQVWGEADDKWKRGAEYYKTLFGAQNDAGHIIFHDAWITPDSLKKDDRSGLVRDVMTPHHGDYYSEKKYESGPKVGKPIPPTDFDDPNPVTFLSVTGSFLVVVSCDVDDEEGQKCAALALGLVKEALREWGVGGKTSSGYGRLAESPWALATGESAPGRVAASCSGPRYKAGDPVTVKRVEDPKNKGRVWFKADDGFSGTVVNATPDALPKVEMGETVELRVAAVLQKGYNFRLPQG